MLLSEFPMDDTIVRSKISSLESQYSSLKSTVDTLSASSSSSSGGGVLIL